MRLHLPAHGCVCFIIMQSALMDKPLLNDEVGEAVEILQSEQENNDTIRNLNGKYKKIEPDCREGVRA